jgi:hypothetical protein
MGNRFGNIGKATEENEKKQHAKECPLTMPLEIASCGCGLPPTEYPTLVPAPVMVDLGGGYYAALHPKQVPDFKENE